MDRWSHAAVSKLASTFGAAPLFPFGGFPFHPFIDWAMRIGESFQSPVGLLVHNDAGLLVSYRGALRFQCHAALPVLVQSPCETCVTIPCLTACPVSARGAQGYDVPSCTSHIEIDQICRADCRVRIACSLSRSYGRDPAQTAFHMKAFHLS